MKQLKKIKDMIEQNQVIEANWVNFPTIKEVILCRKTLLDAGYQLDTSPIAKGYEDQFLSPATFLPQELWFPSKSA